ncbi:MAG: peptide ligase PGM1-related protein [Nitrospira sp.]
MGALSEFGKLGIVAIGETYDRADALYRKSVAVLDREAGTT